ncbi:MAG: hypothetical protein HFE47_00100 [Clostridia bacterium]|nr:hypothetical protein [Clostridia bacterium]
MKLHGYFRDNAVIQADQTCIVKGAGTPEKEVRVKITNAEHSREFIATCDKNGKFAVPCGIWAASFLNHAITVTCEKESITIRNVLFGDVYLGLGQSNMELRLKYLYEYPKTIEEYGKENFRFLDVENTVINYNGKGIFGLRESADDFCAEFCWKHASEISDAESTSGFMYIFCGEMQKKTGRPAAAIHLAVGGSNFADWLPRETIEENPELRRAYADSLPLAQNGQSDAGCIYAEKVAPLKGFAFKGAVWYLGESMAWEGFDHTDTILPAMHALTALYRKELRGGLPMIVMDIGMQSYGNLFVNYANENFGFACREIENLVQCPLFDLSHRWIRPDGNEMYHPIHLVEKTAHAKRAAMLFYENFIAGRVIQCPKITDVKYGNCRAVVSVAHSGKLQTSDGNPIYGFALAGDDEKYVTAQAAFTSDGKIEVFSPWVNKPSRLTYGFFAYNNNCNVTDGKLPLLPYRSIYENADDLPYAVFNPAFFCRYEYLFENSFSAFGGGAGLRSAHTAGKLFGDPAARISYSADGVTLNMQYCPQQACFAGISPEILISGQPHHLERYDELCLELTAEKELELVGIHFRTCEGEQFYLVPHENGKELRNLRLEGGKRTSLFFNLHSAVDRKECTFALSPETRKKIAAMQITFRNRQTENAVTVHAITCYYTAQTDAPATGTDNKDKMFRYGDEK